jgi:hypothetical protein
LHAVAALETHPFELIGASAAEERAAGSAGQEAAASLAIAVALLVDGKTRAPAARTLKTLCRDGPQVRVHALGLTRDVGQPDESSQDHACGRLDRFLEPTGAALGDDAGHDVDDERAPWAAELTHHAQLILGTVFRACNR